MSDDDELAELRYRLHFETDPVKRASLAARIRALGGPVTPQEAASDHRTAEVSPAVRSRLSDAPEHPTQPVIDERGWRRVGLLDSASVLGIRAPASVSDRSVTREDI